MWKYVFLVFVSKLWKCGSVEMFLHCLYLLTPEVWKCGEMCLHCLYPITLEVWKAGNVRRKKFRIRKKSYIDQASSVGMVELWLGSNVKKTG